MESDPAQRRDSHDAGLLKYTYPRPLKQATVSALVSKIPPDYRMAIKEDVVIAVCIVWRCVGPSVFSLLLN